MRIHVMGSAAGGGFPQWNCNCRNCDGLRRGALNASPRTQSSIAISGDDAGWLLCNASPDILSQLRAAPFLQPARALRDTAIRAVLLIDAQIDHVTGLFMLREHRQPLDVWCTDPVREDLEAGNPVFRLLGHYCGVLPHRVPLGGEVFMIPNLPGLAFAAHALTSNAPPYSPRRDRPVPGDNIGLEVTDVSSGRRIFYAPGLCEIDEAVSNAMRRADCVLVDGTCWRDDELIALGISKKRARDMGHRPLDGDGGTLAMLDALPKPTRKVLIHINNTNPILDEDSAENAAVRARGVEIAFDGMELTL
jgi:pyrroloquinoline quinone biosynthesis protein B